jgi:hypothetical protein
MWFEFFSLMFPFDALGLRPYLWIDDAGKKELATLGLKAARLVHPDMVEESQKEEAESKSAALHAALKLLKDPRSLSETLCKNCKVKVAAPDFSMDYFELQERIVNSGSDATLKEDAQRFQKARELERQEAHDRWVKLVMPFSYSGVGDPSSIPWTSDQLNDIAGALQRLKYFEMFFADWTQKFGPLLGDQIHAHSN